MKTEFITLNEERQVTLTAYLQETGGAFPYILKRPAILILLEAAISIVQTGKQTRLQCLI